MNRIPLEGSRGLAVETHAYNYYDINLDYFNKNKVLIRLKDNFDFKPYLKHRSLNPLSSTNSLNPKYEDSLKKISSISKGEYVKWTIKRKLKKDGEYFLEFNRLIGTIEQDLDKIYEFKKDVGHIIPVKVLKKDTFLLNNSDKVKCYKFKTINNDYLKFQNFSNFKDLQYKNANKFHMSISFFSENYIKTDGKDLIIDLSNLKVEDSSYLKVISSFCKGDFLLGEFIYAGEKNKLLRCIGNIKEVNLKNKLEIILENVSKSEEDFNESTVVNIEHALIQKQGINLISKIFNKDRNLILYGPPGTGKTYNLDNEILKIANYYEYNNYQNNREKIHNKVKELQNENQVKFCTFHQSYGYEEFIEGLRSDGKGSFILEDGILKELAIEALFEGLLYYLKADFLENIPSMDDDNIKKEKKNLVLKCINNSKNFDFFNKKQYVIVIDEINRGNISKIFGELITLLEEDKRLTTENELIVKLPYSKELFSLPPNLHLIGTMNSSDKSIAPIDIALRRRFKFKEIMPDESLLKLVENIDLPKMLLKINSRIEYLHDRNYMIGHAYFINCTSKEDIINTLKDKIIPLLQEYFYEDFYKIGLVLGGIGSSKLDKYLVYKEKISPKNLFDEEYLDEFLTSYKYKIKLDISEKELKTIYE